MRDDIEFMISFVMPGKMMDRVTIGYDKYGRQKVTVDLHGLHMPQVDRTLNNLVKIMPGECDLELIHGYNHGTAIKEFIYYRLKNKRITGMISEPSNPGRTVLKIA